MCKSWGQEKSFETRVIVVKILRTAFITTACVLFQANATRKLLKQYTVFKSSSVLT